MEIDTCMVKCMGLSNNIKSIITGKELNIHIVLKSILHVQQPSARQSYSDIAANKKKMINKNKIIIKSDNMEDFDKQLKSKVIPHTDKVNATFYKKN